MRRQDARIGLRLDGELRDRLDHQARKSGRPLSALVREALALVVERQGTATNRGGRNEMEPCPMT
jgi:predicted transcriptional regulator